MIVESNLLRYSALSVLSLYMFHMLRNLTSLYFLVLGLFILFFIIIILISQKKILLDPLFSTAILIWIFVSINSIFQGGEFGDPMIGLFRMWVSLPLLLVGIVLSSGSIKVPMKMLCFFFILATLSICWQYAFGSIFWFAESSERAGGERFASLAGSLTAYGTSVGVFLLAALVFFKGVSRVVVVSFLIIGAILSLQKAGIVNIGFALILAVWIRAISKRNLGILIVFALLVAAVFIAYSPEDGLLGIVYRLLSGFITSDAELTYDVSLLDSIFDRLVTLPAELFSFYGVNNLFIGAGVHGGSGVLGYPELPMAHNGLVEMLSIFGFFVGSIFAIFLIYLLVSSIQHLGNTNLQGNIEFKFLSAAYVIWFMNYLFSGGALFHPIGAATVWLIVFRIRKLNHLSKITTRYKPDACGATFQK